jgi:exopolyphosphatase/guanosine-5'-triphosphate,3'-diphosphate pyrophosphatase
MFASTIEAMNVASPVAQAAPRWPGHLAAIDIGSNSFRLEIGQLHEGRYRRIDYLKETVRLGAGLDGLGMLTEDAALRGLACLARFAQRLQDYAAWQVRAVATQTLREARNRDAFLARATAVLGLPIEVISGREEARLIYAGVARLQPSDQPRLVIDIGGRSTELILGRGHTPAHAESFQIGSVGLSMKYFSDGRFTEAAFRAAQVDAGAQLEEGLEPFAPAHWAEALGSSGTAGAVSHLLAANRVSDGRITPDGLRWLMTQCLQAGHVDKLALPGLKEDRRAVIAGGVAILYTLALNFGVDTLVPARGALRQGVIFDLHERRQAESRDATGQDVRDASVHELQRRFMIDLPQADRVRAVARVLYGNVQPQAAHEARRELDWACALHELGMMVSHHDHHRHGAYVLAHVDSPGFSQSQLRRLSDLALAQRGGLRKIESRLAQPDFAWQAMCLRLAIIACHARGDVDPQVLRLRRDGSMAMLALPPEWVQTHPRTIHLLREESLVWERSGPLSLQVG